MTLDKKLEKDNKLTIAGRIKEVENEKPGIIHPSKLVLFIIIFALSAYLIFILFFFNYSHLITQSNIMRLFSVVFCILLIILSICRYIKLSRMIEAEETKRNKKGNSGEYLLSVPTIELASDYVAQKYFMNKFGANFENLYCYKEASHVLVEQSDNKTKKDYYLNTPRDILEIFEGDCKYVYVVKVTYPNGYEKTVVLANRDADYHLPENRTLLALTMF